MIVSIFISEKFDEPLQRVSEVQLAAGAGIIGDRNYAQHDYPGQNITFIATEAVARYNAEHGQSISPESTRRNVVTEGVDLNALVGKNFTIGPAKFRGVELCTPCSFLGELLENEGMTRVEVVKAFLTSGGLRADVVCGGSIAAGMPFELDPDE